MIFEGPVWVVMGTMGAAFGLFLVWLAYHQLLQRWALGYVRRKLSPEVERRFAGAEILRVDYGANFLGLTSRGRRQLRGNGVLVLTPEKLYFLQAVTKRELAVPIEEMTGVSLARSHLGKRTGRPLLRVEFRSAGGRDAVAWAVRDPEGWAEALESAAAAARARGGGGDDR